MSASDRDRIAQIVRRVLYKEYDKEHLIDLIMDTTSDVWLYTFYNMHKKARTMPYSSED